MAVPLLIGEKVVGVLDLQSKQTGALSQDILAAFEALAGQLAIAIQNANFLSQVEQARAEIESQARHQTRSNWIDYMDAVHKPEETGFVFEQNKVTSLSMAEQSQLQINDNALIAPISVTGEPLGNLVVEMEGQSPISRTSELVNTVARQVSQQIESLRLLESAERYRFEAEEATRHTTREGWKDYMQVNADENMSYIYDLNEVRPFNQNDEQQRDYSATTLPLKVRNENIGKLVVQGLGSDDTESLELAKAVAERLSTHIESLRLAEQTQNTLLFNEKLYSASRAITSTHNEIETALELIKHIEHTNLDRVVIAMKVSDNPVTAQVVAVWDRNGMEDRFLNNRFTDQQIPLVSQMHWDEAMLVNDFNDAPHIDPVTQKTFMALGVKSAAIVPISGGGNLLGWILLETTHALTQFSPESVQAYLSLAGQAATVIQGQRLLAQSQQQAERESTLNTISQKIQSATTVEAVLQIAARELGHALGAPMTIAQLSMKDKK
jgi:GAF domain-containing protein